MTNRMKLLAAAAAIALPAAMAGAQSTAPGGGNHRPTTHSTTQSPPPTTNNATEDAQPAATPPADTPAAVNRNAEPGTQGDETSQAQAQTPPAGQAAPVAQAQAAAPATPATPATATAAATPATPATPATAAVRAATAADLHAGVQVHDQAGGVVGTVESADASGAVVSTGTVRARLPLTSFAANSQGGLVIAMTRTQLEAAAHASSHAG